VDVVIDKVLDVGAATDKPEQLMDNALEEDLLGGEEWKAISQIKTYSGIEAFKGLDPNDQPKFDAMTTRAGELVRGGMDPEKAVHQSIDETLRKFNMPGDAKSKGGTKDFTPLFLTQPGR
jgi:hypothetical protein